MNASPSHHAVNAVVAAAPVASFVSHLPETVTVVAGILASIYYVMLMFDWISKKVRTWKQIIASARSVGQRLKDEEDAARAADKDAP